MAEQWYKQMNWLSVAGFFPVFIAPEVIDNKAPDSLE